MDTSGALTSAVALDRGYSGVVHNPLYRQTDGVLSRLLADPLDSPHHVQLVVVDQLPTRDDRVDRVTENR